DPLCDSFFIYTLAPISASFRLPAAVPLANPQPRRFPLPRSHPNPTMSAQDEAMATLIRKPKLNLSEMHEWTTLQLQHTKAKPPDKHTDRAAWNAHCERSIMFQVPYTDSDTPPLGQITVSIPPPDLLLPELNLSIALWSKELMHREGVLAVECLVDGNFEAKRDATDMERRRGKAHKRFYDQERFDPAMLVPMPERPPEFIGCPPEDLRGPALWRQIGYLSEAGSRLHDCVLAPAPGHTPSLTLFRCGAQVHTLFLVARRCAMPVASGSRAAVAKTLEILRCAPQAYMGF
ncbi:hypothetical protein GGX14DRAFT_625050, partial [Mycena pura]